MTEEVRKKIAEIMPYYNLAKEEDRIEYSNRESDIMIGYSLAEKELAEKDRIIAEQKLALNEAEKKIKQLDTKPY